MVEKNSFIAGVKGEPGTLSVCMIVKNEAAILARCLESLGDAADEIVVVDTGSTDETVCIAERFSARVIVDNWRNDFSYARNISLRHATSQWILWLDADDVVPAETVAQLHLLKKETPDKILGLVVRNQRPDKTGSEFIQARMLPNHESLLFERRIHEQIMFSADRAGLVLKPCAAVIEHHGYADPLTLKKKARRNTQLLLLEYVPGQQDPVLLVEIGDSYTILEEFDEAFLWYQRVLSVESVVEQHPVIASQAWLGLGNISNKRQQYIQAAGFFAHALTVAPSRPDVRFSMAIAQEKAGDVDEAIRSLQEALLIKPSPMQVSIDFRQTFVKSFIRLQFLLWRTSQVSIAENWADKALALHADRPEIYNNIAALRIRQGKLLEALGLLEQSLTLAPNANLDALIGLCIIYHRAGRQALVEQTLEDLKSFGQSVSRYWAFVGLMNQKLDKTIPEQIKSEDVEKETAYLKELYLL